MITPRGAFGYIALTLVILKPFVGWIVFKLVNPDATIPIRMLYRGDFQCFQVLTGLAHLNVGETAVLEHLGKGLAHYPLALLGLHAFWYRLAGPFGFLVADLLVCAAYYVLFGVFLRLLGIGPLPARCASLLAVTLERCAGRFTKEYFGFYWALYGWRFTRPFITQLFLVSCLVMLLVILLAPSHRKRLLPWLLLGISVALLGQGDPWSFSVVMLLIAALALYLFVTDPRSWRVWVSRCLFLAVTALIFFSPLIAQKIFEHPDVSVRIGLIHLGRTAVFQLPLKWPIFVVGLCLSAGAAGLILKRFPIDETNQRRILGLQFTAVALIAALIAPSVSVLLTGKALQIWHFRDTLMFLSSALVLIIILNSVELAGRIIKTAADRGRIGRGVPAAARTAALVGVVLLSLGMFRGAQVYAEMEFARGPCPPGTREAGYRRNFIELTHELKRLKRDGVRVLGSFDHQLIAWWTAFAGGFSYLSDTATSTLSDDEIERRLIGLCKTIGMTPDEFISFIGYDCVNYLWLAHEKYEVYRDHTFAPLNEYDGETRARILRTKILTGRVKAIPKSERERLRGKYAKAVLNISEPRLDAIVLSKGPALRDLVPPRRYFRKVFENPTFTVWRKKRGTRN